MSNSDQRKLTKKEEIIVSRLISTQGVQEGLRLPETPEEVEIFEREIVKRASPLSKPSLDLDIFLNKYAVLGETFSPELSENKIDIDSEYLMAARNGSEEVSQDILDSLDSVIEKSKQKK